ncbi:MAG: ASPIC/UnbV domain-containing protein, partial [Planctomycetaceae bacterium]|nr:ASPIC/UnbV domain-containing protein [Planctomycetaceae bacterium]
VAHQCRLRLPSLPKLGFGVQFLDADLDGQLDLVVANGHIDDYSADGHTEFRMQPQFFANLGAAGFREIPASTSGPYFERHTLGRSLARLDWNGDGLEDFAVTHLDAPVSLVENTTADVGRQIVFRLQGITSNRDAVGASVRVRTPQHTLTREITAGDGFQATNERVLVFGLGADDIVQDVTIDWPSGISDRFTNVPVNTSWMVIEGRNRLFASRESPIPALQGQPRSGER